jgi:glycosyltransferase involved in cell wall biosynthesis
MGFGHYERLFINNYYQKYPSELNDAEILYSGRGDISSDLSVKVKQSSLGYSIQRLGTQQWWVASNIFSTTVQKKRIVHSMSMDFPLMNNLPSVVTVHDIPPYHFSDEGVLPRWSKDLLKSVSLIHVPSEFSKHELIRFMDTDESKIHVIPYGLESEIFNEGVSTLSNEDKQRLGLPNIYILFAAGASQRKNLPNLLNAWSRIQSKYPDIQLALAGPPRVGDILELHHNCNAKYIGYLNRQDLPRAMKSSLFVTCPSIYEGFGLPALEALACGVPVLTTSLSAIPEVVGNAALKCPTGSVDDLASGLQTLIENPALREHFISVGPNQARHFSWSDHVQKMQSLYKQL